MNQTTLWIAIILVAAAAFYAMRAAGKDTSAAKDKIKQGALVLDVRTAGEFAGGHYTGAVNIPVQELKNRISELGSTNRAVVVYCAAGVRAGKAKQILLDAGFKDVTNAGGLSDLQK